MADRKLRVLYSFPHPMGRAGTGHTAWHQVQGLAAQGFEITVCCTSLARELPGAHRVVETVKPAGVRIPHRVLGVARTMRLHDWRTARWLERAGREFDAVHGWPLASAATFRVARRLGVTAVREVPNTHAAHLYDIVGREHMRLNLPLPRQHLHGYNASRLERQLEEYALADVILAPSEYSRQTFIDRGIAADKLAIHRYGFSPQDIPRADLDASPTTDRPFTVTFLGRGEPRKGLHYALPAWVNSGAAAGGRFRIAGGFIPGYEEALGRWLDAPGVERLGFQRNVADVLRASDALVLPSVEEGSALVTYEALASGCVLLVSTVVGARCRHEHDALLHEPGDIPALSEHIRRLADDPTLRATMRRNAAASYDELTWDKAGEELAGVYERAVG